MLVSHPQPASVPHFDSPHPAALVSPPDMAWNSQRPYPADTMDVVSWNYYTLPPSPPASVSSNTDDSPQLSRKAIRPHPSPEPHSDSEQQPCLPTNQVFELDAPSSSSSASPPPSTPHPLTLSPDSGPSSKKAFSTIGGVKKGRGNGERITTKDFVPPDVTGLSKREARLLKNRAAAFLSRQRKREEFEAMEIRVRELEEENSRLQLLAAKGKKYDDLLSNTEQLRLRLSVTEKRERELTVELANQTTSLTIKRESHDVNLPPSPYSPYAGTGQGSIVTTLKQSLLSALPSFLSLPPQASLPVGFSVPLVGSSTARPSSAVYVHPSAPCDLKDQGRPRFSHESVGFHPSSVDVDSLQKMAFGGKGPEARQFNMESPRCFGSLVVSFDVSPTEDGRGCVHVQVSERATKPAVHGSRQRPPLLTSWPGADPSFGMTCYASSPLSAPVSVSSPGGIDHVGVFASTGSAPCRIGFDTQLMSPGYAPFAQHDPEHPFAYYAGMISE